MQISDIHIGNRFDYQYIIDSFKEAQRLQPDFVVYTGDYVSYENEEQYVCDLPIWNAYQGWIFRIRTSLRKMYLLA